jgi:hypothetical protein
MSFGTDKGEVLVPTVSEDGRIMSSAEAKAQYLKTGRHLGIFKTPQAATSFAKSLHEQQDKYYHGGKSMASDPVEEARRKQAAMLRRSSYFPAANLRQFEGTELSPPGAGTYYNPSRYIGASYGNQRRAERNLAGAWQSDLAFNVMHNPGVAASLDSERIGAQYGGGKSFAGKPGYQTVQLPGGGTTVVSDAVAKRLMQQPGYSVAGGMARSSPAEAYQLGFTGQPGFSNVPTAQQTPYQRSYLAGYQGGREGAGVTVPQDPGLGYHIGEQLGRIGTLGYNAIASLFRGAQPRFASERGDLLRDTEGTFYGGGNAPIPTPTPTPAPSSNFLAYNQPRRYFDE